MANEMVTIYVMGKPYEVPENLTIMKAMEYAGYRFVRGCGCRGAFCGACGTVYRLKDDYRLRVALACQEVVQDGMYLAEIPFFPGNKATYDIEDLKATLRALRVQVSGGDRAVPSCAALPQALFAVHRAARSASRAEDEGDGAGQVRC
jgi:hypothetical protein